MKSLIIIVGLVAVVPPLAAQTDYRNLDAEHPLRTEDAYAIERGALEFAIGAGRSFGVAGDGHLGFEPELAVGLRNAQLSFAWPFGRSDGGALHGLGPRVGLLLNPITQPRRWPALAFRVDGALVDGLDGASDLRVGGTLIATRAFGMTRVHLNASFNAGPESPKYDDEFPARYEASIALDRSLWRNSLLLGIEGGVAQTVRGADPTWLGGAGLRWQWTPTDVLDLGYRATSHLALRTSHSFSVGLTHAWGWGRPSRRAALATPSTFDRRDEQFYAPGRFNWSFLRKEPDAARLFNAFDYGHAVLYERLLTERGESLETSLAAEYRFLTRELLVRPPRFAVAEEGVMPTYAMEMWRAKQVFEWAHVLHRQIYDVYAHAAASGLGPEATDSIIEALTDRYLARREYALAPLPKSMALMEGQPYSGAFARQQPKFNGLIWAYHWLQVGLYEPYARDLRARRDAGVHTEFQVVSVAPVVGHFRSGLAAERYPEVMPMTSAVAPAFTDAHPRAAAIFDNLHSLHDVISDILLNDAVVPRAEKRAAIWRAVAEYQDATRDLESDEHWRMMGEMVGGVERMGGAVP
jgi:hypothetical protein